MLSKVQLPWLVQRTAQSLQFHTCNNPVGSELDPGVDCETSWELQSVWTVCNIVMFFACIMSVTGRILTHGLCSPPPTDE